MSLWELEIKPINSQPVASKGIQGLRRQVWGTIGESLGKSWGESLGAQMDALVLAGEEAIKKAVPKDGN